MKRQTIYIALALNPDNRSLVPLCWHTDKSRAGDVAQPLPNKMGFLFSAWRAVIMLILKQIPAFPMITG
ncbi:MAG: hypothetical protein V7K89_09425 [Nostoc sp.]|uniref:hypothetical protein n=1 Tax=Nostoc sp. TaxID=1180 RepID=UPI002FFA14A5